MGCIATQNHGRVIAARVTLHPGLERIVEIHAEVEVGCIWGGHI